MTLQSSGTIKFSEIEDEFGQIAGTNNRKVGSYRISQTIGGLINLPLDTGIPQPGSPISFSDFYSKRCNILVNFYTIDENRVDARNKYDNGDVQVVGPGVKSPPSAGSGVKVRIHVNKNIGSQAVDGGSQSYCALRTGTWDTETDDEGCELQVDVGANGLICGAGGNGGQGGYKHSSGGSPSNGEGFPGEYGNSGLGIQHDNTDVVVLNGGFIVGGYGGGGGAPGFEYTNQEGEDHEVRGWGGGGGGGAGIPAGEGRGNYSDGYPAGIGQDGSMLTGGAGGEGDWTHGDQGCSGGICAGDGGNGGGQEFGVAAAGGPSRNDSQDPGAGGASGAAIRRTSGLTVNITNGGTISGATDATGVL